MNMRVKMTPFVLAAAILLSSITGCGNTRAKTSAGNSPYAAFIASLHAGQYYAIAPIYEGKDALFVTSYAFDDQEGHSATYEATIFVADDGSVKKVTTIQSGGTAYPIAVTEDHNLILSMRNSVLTGYVAKESGRFVITEESDIRYTADEGDPYHDYRNNVAELSTDSALFDELSERYLKAGVLNFTKAGISSDGKPLLSGAVYAAYEGEDLYHVSCYYVFENESTGHTQTPDGVSGIPFSYEMKNDGIVFHFGSADDTSEAVYAWNDNSYPTITFTGDDGSGEEKLSLVCLGNEDAGTFDAVKYYDNDNNLYMQVKSFDKTTFTGDLYREERIRQEDVDQAEENGTLYSVNGTPFTVVSFAEANRELAYGTDEEFKADVIGGSRFDGFLVRCSDDDFCYALEKQDYETEYHVVSMLTEGNLRKCIEENVTFPIKENCEITLQKFVENEVSGNLEEEYIIGREFKGDAYPGWSEGAQEYYMTNDMLVAIGVIDGELYNVSQVYIP